MWATVRLEWRVMRPLSARVYMRVQRAVWGRVENPVSMMRRGNTSESSRAPKLKSDSKSTHDPEWVGGFLARPDHAKGLRFLFVWAFGIAVGHPPWMREKNYCLCTYARVFKYVFPRLTSWLTNKKTNFKTLAPKSILPLENHSKQRSNPIYVKHWFNVFFPILPSC